LIHQAEKPGRLPVEFGGGGGAFLSARRIVLGYLRHLRHRTGHLLDVARLLDASRVHLGDQRFDLARLPDDLTDHRRNLIDTCLSVGRFFDGFLDQARGILRRLCATPGQATHFVRHDCESLPRFARSRRLDGGIQREDIRLECNLVDYLDNFRNPAALIRNLAHRDHHLVERPACLAEPDPGLSHKSGGLLGVLSIRPSH